MYIIPDPKTIELTVNEITEKNKHLVLYERGKLEMWRYLVESEYIISDIKLPEGHLSEVERVLEKIDKICEEYNLS